MKKIYVAGEWVDQEAKTEPNMSDIKCCSCGKKLGEASIQQGELRIKCKCGTVNVVKAETESTESFTDRLKLEKKMEFPPNEKRKKLGIEKK